MRALLAAAALLLLGRGGAAAAAAPFDHEHAAFQRLLEKVRRDGLVDYEALAADPRALEDYIEDLAGVDAGEYSSWTPQQKTAYWLNAANAFTLKTVADRYPFKRRHWWSRAARRYPANSVKQDQGFDDAEFTAAGRPVTLAQAREMAVQVSTDARVVFAVACPCLGGPPLPPQAFRASDLDSQLEAAARAFVANPARVRVDSKARTLFLSMVLSNRRLPDPLAFARRYLPQEQAEALDDPGWRLAWIPFDWTLDSR